MYKAARLIIGNVVCRESHVEHFDPNGYFVHLVQVF